MLPSRTIKCLIFIAIYLIAVIACIYLAFNFKGSINSEWTMVLMALTLPWSIISVVFMWALVHGAGLGFFAVMYFSFAIINSFFIYKLFGAPQPDEMS
ncbi:MAG TPA: hypothetical protein VF599_18910 [Pyrinomonadaceae bacterium]|jgi:hypothetical protein